jgi:hypothetical protein
MKGTAPAPIMLPAAFLKEVRARSQSSGTVIFTNHGKVRKAERKVTDREILTVLRLGALDDGPIWDAKHGTFEGRLRHLVAGRDLCVVAALIGGDLMVTVITAYQKGRRK